jgi:hypothetical protein
LLEASNDPELLANGYVAQIDYLKYRERLKVHDSPWQFSETPAHIGIAPELGAHNDEILARLGYAAAQIEICGRKRSSDAEARRNAQGRVQRSSRAFAGKKVYGCEVHHTSNRRERLGFLLLILLSSRCGPRCLAPGANNQQIVQSCKTLKR